MTIQKGSSVQPNMQIHTDIATSMVKVFHQQALLSNILMSMPVFWEKRIHLSLGVTAVENVSKLSDKDPIEIVMTKLTSAPLQGASHL